MQKQTFSSDLFKKAAKSSYLSTRLRFEYQSRGPAPPPKNFLEIGPNHTTRIEGEGAIAKCELRSMMRGFDKILRAWDDPKWFGPRRWVTVALEISAESPDDRIARIERRRITAPRGHAIELYVTRKLLVLASKYGAYSEFGIRVDGLEEALGNVHYDAKRTWWPEPLSLKKGDLLPQALAKTWMAPLNMVDDIPDSWHDGLK